MFILFKKVYYYYHYSFIDIKYSRKRIIKQLNSCQLTGWLNFLTAPCFMCDVINLLCVANLGD